MLASLPASDTATSPHAQSDNIEVGGQRGREAPERLRNVVERVATSRRPASMEDGFEIDARLPSGVPDNVVRIVTENCRTLKFESQGFEEI